MSGIAMTKGDLREQPASLPDLPADVLLLICARLDAQALAALSRTSRTLRAFVVEFGWRGFVLARPRNTVAFPSDLVQRSWLQRARFLVEVDRAWGSRRVVGQQLGLPGRGHHVPPLIRISERRIVLTSGGELRLWDADSVRRRGGSLQLFDAVKQNIGAKVGFQDVTASAFLDRSGGRMVVGQADGAVQLLDLDALQEEKGWKEKEKPRSINGNGGRGRRDNDAVVCAGGRAGPSHLPLSKRPATGSAIQALHAEDGLIAVASRDGTVSVYDSERRDPEWRPLGSVSLPGRPWSAALSLRGPRKSLTVGTKGRDPLQMFTLTETGLLESPISLFGTARMSAVYGLSSPPYEPYTILTGWYDGVVRLYDTRCPAVTLSRDDGTRSRGLCPSLALLDPMDNSSVYCLEQGGGHDCHVVAGTARHSSVKVWDRRMPKEGWSIFAAHPRSSPVYSVALEHSRVWGAVDDRLFTLDFAPEQFPPRQGVADVPVPMNDGRRRGRRKQQQGSKFLWPSFYLHRDMQLRTTSDCSD